MATAKSLTPAELDRVLTYTSTQPYAQRNRAMLMMTVAAGLRVSEVAGLTLGDMLDSKGCVRGEVFLAAHRVKHQHARTIYINSRLQQELADYIATRTNKDPALPLFPTHRGPRCSFFGCIERLVLATPVRTAEEKLFCPLWPRKESLYLF
jgi:integrase/recombinase XerD